MHSYFPEFIYEAIIQEVDYKTGFCTLSPLNPRQDMLVDEVPLPQLAGTSNAGIWVGNFKKGTRVIVANTSGEGREFPVIVGYAPQLNLFSHNFENIKPKETPAATIAYPDLEEGRIVLRGDRGSELILNEHGDTYLKTAGFGSGEYFRKNNLNTSVVYRIIHDQSNFSNAGRLYHGVAKRLGKNKRNFFPKNSLNETPLFTDLDFHFVANSLGFFNGSIPLKYSYQNKKRNPEISEFRMIINEFATDSMFSGFDDEVLRVKNNKKQFDKIDTFERHREPSNVLQLAEHELIEFIAGNVIDFKGNILDINYRSLAYGDSGNKTPKKDIEQAYEIAKRVSRRGLGIHFQLANNVQRKVANTSESSFILDIDKEGVLKLNIPKSSDTGNIPFSNIVEFEDGAGNVKTSYAKESNTESIPVTLRDKNGNVVLPAVNDKTYRETGLRFSNTDLNPYFPSNSENGSNTVRVNTTKYHNMYAIAERLIANDISSVEIPETFTDNNGLATGNPFGHPFEVYQQSDTVATSVSDLNSNLPEFMSVVKVMPAAPAINSGGNTTVAGTVFEDDELYPPYSNSFVVEKNADDEFEALIKDPVFGDNKLKVGGKSAFLDLAGSLEASIGSDNTDQKSILLDTAGSLIAWLGKDINGRSMVLQTDGEMLINVGGTYNNSSNNTSMNIGKFVLRVNITDKKFVDTAISDEKNNPYADSDFIISISEEGLVIAGMKQGVPMVIRNDGKILIESASDLVLKGQKVETVEAKGTSTTPNVSGRG